MRWASSPGRVLPGSSPAAAASKDELRQAAEIVLGQARERGHPARIRSRAPGLVSGRRLHPPAFRAPGGGLPGAVPSVHPMTGARTGSRVARIAPPGFALGRTVRGGAPTASRSESRERAENASTCVEPVFVVGGSGLPFTAVTSRPSPPRGPTWRYWPDAGAFWPGFIPLLFVLAIAQGCSLVDTRLIRWAKPLCWN